MAASPTPSATDWDLWLEETLFAAVFDRLDTVFPEFGWTRRGAGWVATNREHTKARYDARPERVVCLQPGGFYVHGGTPEGWLAYAHGGTSPRGADFFRVLETLGDRVGITIPERLHQPEQRERLLKQQHLQDLYETFLSLTLTTLRTSAIGAPARQYLAARGWAESLWGPLPIGCCPPLLELQGIFDRAGFAPDLVEQSGILADGRWVGRLLLPWRDARGRLATFAARDVSGTAEAGAKYLYLKGGTKPPVFGLPLAPLSVIPAFSSIPYNTSNVPVYVIVEGLLDVLAFRAAGYPTVLALGGGGGLLTAERWTALRQLGLSRVVLALDHDATGLSGTWRALDNAHKVANPDNVPDIYVVPPAEWGSAKDPEAFLQAHGLEATVAIFDRAQGAARYRAEVVLGECTPQSPELVRRGVQEQLLSLAAELRGPFAETDRVAVLDLLATRTGVDREALGLLLERQREAVETAHLQASLRSALREAESAQAQGATPQTVVRSLAHTLGQLQAATIAPPPPFGVARLEAETRHLAEGRSSGWAAVDALEVRFNPGELAILGARTGHGKTSTLVGLLWQWLAEERGDVLVCYSAEEPEVRIFHRLWALTATIHSGRRWSANLVRDYIRGGPEAHPLWPGPPRDDLEAAREWLQRQEPRLWIVARPSWGVEELAGHARHMAAGYRGAIGGVLVDYLQRLPPPPQRFDRRDQEVSAIGRELKALAIEIQAPVVVGAQIGRQAVQDHHGQKLAGKSYHDALPVIQANRPELHHLREGGSEQEADLVLGLLHYASDYHHEAGEGSVVPEVTLFEIGTLKNRYGPVGRWAKLAFEASAGRLRDPQGGDW